MLHTHLSVPVAVALAVAVAAANLHKFRSVTRDVRLQHCQYALFHLPRSLFLSATTTTEIAV